MRFISCTAAQPITLEAYPVTVLHIHPTLMPAAAIKSSIVQEFRNASPTEA